MTTTATSDLLLPGYWVDEATGAWCSIPWPTDPDEKQRLADHSIGPLLIRWAENRLDPDEYEQFGPGLMHYQSKESWVFTPGQKRFLILWYHVGPDGRFSYRSGIKRGAKGIGKDPFAAAMCDTELCGPVEFVDFDRDGLPVSQSRGFPLVQVLSNSQDQSKDVLRVANAMWGNAAREYYGLDTGDTRTVVRSTGGRFEVPPSAEESGEGDPATFIALNEALALDTPIPTPTGWTTMGALRVGDRVLAPNGEPTAVTKATDVYEGRPCYRVTFQDGDSIVADAGHLWLAQQMGWPHAPKIVTTQEMVDRGGKYKVPPTAPIELPEAELPVEPYVLGAWLGDGSRGSCALTTSAADMAWWLEEFGRLGVQARFRRSTATGEEITLAGAPHSWEQRGTGMRAALVRLGVYEKKSIPATYLRASLKQRLALLQGLIDTDGCVDTNGRVIFVNTNTSLAEGVAELARSLGHIVHVSQSIDRRKASYLPVYRVEWQGDATLPSARMPRKADRLHTPTSKQSASRWARIDSIEPVASVPVRCIAVDSADHLFLAGQWKSTHNSHHMTHSNGGDDVANVARRNVGKSPKQIQARLVEFTNAHRQGGDSEAEKSFRAWQKQQAPGYRGKRDILYDSIEAAPPFDIVSEEGRRRGLRQAYLDAPWNDIERKSDEMADDRLSVADAIRFYLNGLGTEEDAWIEPPNFDALAEQRIVLDKDQIAVFLDCSKSGDATAMTATRLSDMYTFVPFGDSVWERPHGWDVKKNGKWLAPRDEVDAKARAVLERYEVVWFGIDPSPAEDDDTEALYWRPMVDGLHRDFRRKLAVWATPGDTLGNAVLFDMRLSQRGGVGRNQMFTEAAEMVQKWIDEEGTESPMRHDGHPILRQHVHNARQRGNSWGTSLSKVTRDSSKHIDLAVCMVGSNMGARIALNSGKLRRRKKTGSSDRVAVVM